MELSKFDNFIRSRMRPIDVNSDDEMVCESIHRRKRKICKRSNSGVETVDIVLDTITVVDSNMVRGSD
jgi:hypothetical protein